MLMQAFSSFMRGKLVTFEGIDGSGKTTLAKATYEKLMTRYPMIFVREPTKTWLGEAVRRAISSKINPFSEALLFMADHADLGIRLADWLSEGKLVLSDRYNDSNYAYQAVTLKDKLDKPMDWLMTFQKPFTIVPDLTFLIVIDPELALKRLNRERTKFEVFEFLRKVEANYLKLAETSRFVKLDGCKPVDTLVNEVIAHIEKVYNEA